MKRDKWNVNFDWTKSGSTWVLQNRNEQYNENRFISINDIYFKHQKYLSGVSYTYINKLEDIYKRDLLTGDGYALYNMYNEYDIVDRVMKNIQFVDVAATSNIDITKQWRKINNIQLKAGQYVLLNKQDSEFENDVYKVTQQNFLENVGFLSTRNKSERFSVSVKSGVYKDKQFFLLNNGDEFPITNEPKHFIEGNSFILKHIIKYNLYNTSSNSAVTSKIIFTDYEIAKKQLPINSSLYDNIDFTFSNTASVNSDYFQIHHHHDSYYIRTGTTEDRYVTGLTSDISNGKNFITTSRTTIDVVPTGGTSIYLTGGTGLDWVEGLSIRVSNGNDNYFIGEVTSYNDSNGQFIIDVTNGTGTTGISYWNFDLYDLDIEDTTMFKNISPFIANEFDYIRVMIYTGSTVFIDFYTHVKQTGSEYIILEDTIPNRLLRYTTGMKFKLYNQNIAVSWSDAIDQLETTPYSKFFNISDSYVGTVHNLTISPKEYKYDKYFDYDNLNFKIIDGGLSSSFNSLNNYITYNLYTRLNLVNPYIFTSSFSFYSGFTSTTFSSTYIDNNRIKLSFTNSGDTQNLREYTYVYLNNNSSYKSLIWKIDGGDIYIEKPAIWSGTTAVTQIDNIDGLYNISQILQEVYMNVEYDWYIPHKDNIRRRICSAYAQLLSENEDFKYNVTGILYENEYNEFILKLYDVDTDHQLDFTTIELMRLGSDKKTRIPVPLRKDSVGSAYANMIITEPYSVDWNILDDGLIYSGVTFSNVNTASGTTEVFDFGYDVVLGGPNDPPLMFNIIDGNA